MSPSPEPVPDEAVLETLGLGRSRARRRVWPIVGGVAVVLAGGVALALWLGSGQDAPWTETTVERQDLDVVVTAVGTLQPSETVSVGSEQSGLVDEVLVQANDRVTAGQVLARLDTEQLQHQLTQARANERVAQGTVAQAKATLESARRELGRNERMGPQVVSREALDKSKDAVEQAEAALTVAQGQLSASRAARELAQVAVDKAEIKSPVDGVVLTRSVDPGQPVVSALQASTLFEVASDLARMELVVDVDEADVGRVTEGMRATFTVPAFPDRVWEAEVLRVDLAPEPAASVVVYAATLGVDNADGKLRPGMTATSTLVADHHAQVLTVPAGALRFTPPDVLPRGEPTVWTLETVKRNKLRPKAVPVQIIASDGATTAIEPGALDEGEVVLLEGP